MSNYSYLDTTTADLDYPLYFPSTSIDFVNSKSIPPEYTFTRNSSGTYVGPDGLIKTANVNQPRFDYDPITKEFKGLLIEEGNSNPYRYSNAWGIGDSNSPDGVFGVVDVTSNYGIAPDGTKTSVGFLRTTSQIRTWYSSIPNSNGANCFSFFAKPIGTQSNVTLNHHTGINISISYYFNTLTSSGTVSNVSAFSHGIIKYPNDWYRVYLVFVSPTLSFWPSLTAQQTIEVWGKQLEAGSFPTSYIPTSGSTVTRLPDQLILNKSLSTSGTFFVEARPTTGTTLVADNGTNAYYISPTRNIITKNALYYNTNRVLTMSSTTTNPTQLNINTPPGINRVSLGFDRINNTSYINGYIKNFKYYDSPVTEDNLRSLTGNNRSIFRASPVIDGLVLHLNAADYFSYSGSGTTWRDLSGNGITGTLTNGPTYSSANGGFLSFDGTDDFVNIPSGIPRRTDKFTNEIWVYPTSLTGGEAGYSTLIKMYGTRPDNTGADFYFVLKDAGQVHCEIANVSNTGYDLYTTSNGVVSINNWYHIVQVIDRSAGNLKFYVNNSLVLNASTSTYSIITSSSIQIAQQGTNPSNPYARRLTGRVSNVKLYNRALSATEVQQNFNALRGRFGI